MSAPQVAGTARHRKVGRRVAKAAGAAGLPVYAPFFGPARRGAVGNAVTRNRVRRRLRAAVREERSGLQAGWGYLVRASAGAQAATYGELRDAVRVNLTADSDKTP